MYTVEEVLDYVKEEDVKFVRLAFFDVFGKQKNISIIANELSRAFEIGISFDASAITGFESPDKSDLYLHPDPSTLVVLPWRPSQGKVIRLLCDIKYPDGTPYEKDCRYILKQAVKAAKEKCNVTFHFGSEIEFYLFKLDENGEKTNTPLDNASYMDIAPEDKGENIRREICYTLEQMGIRPEASHHEEGPGQNEIDFLYSNPLTSADNSSTFKWVVRQKAASQGLYADFSPKPLANKAGSGMHINVSAHSFDIRDNTDYTESLIAGIIKHIKEITLFLNPTEDSYERLGSCKAPRYISWDKENRSQLIRLPAYKKTSRLEVRSADPEANPYLAFALIIYAAIDGISNKLKAPEPVTANLFSDTETASKLDTLPETLQEAGRIAMNSSFVKEFIPQDIIAAYSEIANKNFC